MVVDHIEHSVTNLDSDKVVFSASTKGVITFDIGAKTDFTVGVSSISSKLSPEFHAELRKQGKAFRDDFEFINAGKL